MNEYALKRSSQNAVVRARARFKTISSSLKKEIAKERERSAARRTN